MIASVWSLLRFDSTSFAHIRSYRPISNTKDNFSYYILLCAITIDLIVRKCYCAQKSPIECEKSAEREKRVRTGIPRHTSCRRWKMTQKRKNCKQLLRMTFHCRNSKWNKMCKCGGYRRLQQLPSDSFNNNKNNNIIIARCRECERARALNAHSTIEEIIK